ncbi:sporulation integral membrane protein YtvI [uncultured Tyzzerella sp.]|uniref:sporulation integral membrane protein YtvI n=1 Tax=uncultured Tyzzerella sp. TaxID=2321398 RepID=UPI002941F364|nr:sporulation integral membrane protein YtvI [uncultured Tyzzerella sp.]
MSFLANKENILKIIKLILSLLFIYLFLNYIGGLFLPFIIGYILCIILYPLFKILNKRYKIPKHLSSILCISTLIFLVVFIGVGVVGQIIKEGKEFIKDLPFYINSIKLTFDQINQSIKGFFTILPDGLERTVINFFENFSSLVGEFLSNGLKNTSIKVIKKVPNALMITIISIISCYLMLIDKENIQKFIIRQLPKKYSDKFNIVKSGIGDAVFGYIRAQLIIMCLIAAICFIGLLTLKAPYALFIAVVIGIIDALPVFGSGFIIWPWALYNVIIQNYGLAIGLIIIYVVILVTRQIVEPKILGKQIGIHPLATLMSIYVGLQLFGVFGFIIGPVIMVVIKALQNENILPKWR